MEDVSVTKKGVSRELCLVEKTRAFGITYNFQRVISQLSRKKCEFLKKIITKMVSKTVFF